jgi:hypothetical protein
MTFIDWPPMGEESWFYRIWKEGGKQMTWTVTKEEGDKVTQARMSDMLHVRAIIDLEKQDELKALIEALQKHVLADSS